MLYLLCDLGQEERREGMKRKEGEGEGERRQSQIKRNNAKETKQIEERKKNQHITLKKKVKKNINK